MLSSIEHISEEFLTWSKTEVRVLYSAVQYVDKMCVMVFVLGRGLEEGVLFRLFEKSLSFAFAFFPNIHYSAVKSRLCHNSMKNGQHVYVIDVTHAEIV